MLNAKVKMMKTLLLSAVGFIYLQTPFTQGGELSRIKILIIDGYSNHDWQRTTRLARGILEPTGLFDVTVSTAPATTNDPAIATWSPKFKDFDVVIQTCNDLGGRVPLWPAPVRDAFEQFVRQGGGVFALHSGNNAFA